MFGRFRATFNAFLGSAAEGSNEAKEESRIHERFALASSRVGKVVTARGLELPIVNLSYGGFATDKLELFGAPTEHYEDAHLFFLDQEVAVKVKKIYATGSITGFAFEHREPKALLFLREILECLRYGLSLHEIRKAFVVDAYQGDEWLCLRGEGPSELVMRLLPNGEACELMCSFRNGETTHELHFSNGQWSTRKGSGEVSATLDRDTLRSGIHILLGLNQPRHLQAVAPLLKLAETYFGSSK